MLLWPGAGWAGVWGVPVRALHAARICFMAGIERQAVEAQVAAEEASVYHQHVAVLRELRRPNKSFVVRFGLRTLPTASCSAPHSYTSASRRNPSRRRGTLSRLWNQPPHRD
jgi:hypothetical protein